MKDFKAGDIVWYAPILRDTLPWKALIIRVPRNEDHEIDLVFTEPNYGEQSRPRRRLFHNQLDARNCVR